MNTQAPTVDPEVENDPTGVTAGVDTVERPATSISSTAVFPVALLPLAGFIYSIHTLIIGATVSDVEELSGIARIIADILLFLLVLILTTSLAVISPGQASIRQFFGKYVGTVHRTGLVLVPPLASGKKVFVKVRNFETNGLKVNDSDDNPANIAAIIVWQVADTARAAFAVEEYEEFIRAQAKSVPRHVVTTHPYDESGSGETSFRENTDLVGAELAEEVANRIALAGLEIVEARISSLTYASGIAQAMFQHQQAEAVIATREQIVEGAVTTADQALKRLENNDIVELDDERKAQMVSNFLVALCSDTRTQSVVNAGSPY